ncbi:MAG: hypothetical protein RR365_03430 [Bacteroides sp.]
MAKYVKVVLFLLVTFLFYSMVSKDSAAKAEGQDYVTLAGQQVHGSCFTKSQSPYLPDAELLGGGGTVQQINLSRVQRSHISAYSTFLKGLVQNMAYREAALSRHQGRIYDTTTSYYCHPVSLYYVFALRRILI